MKFYAKKVGPIVHWRIGRVGGSFYVAKAKRPTRVARPIAEPVAISERVAMIAATYHGRS